MDGLQIFFIIGALAGIISLYWKLMDLFTKWIYRPKMKVMVDIIHEDGEPISVKIKATNNGGETVHLIEAGFILNNKMIYQIKFGGGLLRWVRSGGGSYEDKIDFEKLKDAINEQKTSIKEAYVQSDKLNIYRGEVPEDLNTLILK